MSIKKIFLFLSSIILIIAIGLITYVLITKTSTVNSPAPSIKNNVEVDSSIKGYQLKLNDADTLTKVAKDRGLYSTGVIEPNRNNFVPVKDIRIELVNQEMPMIKAFSGNTIISSGNYFISNQVLNIQIYVNEKYLGEEDLKLANYYFTRKLLEFLVAVSPKTTAEGNQSGTNRDLVKYLTQDKTLKEIDSLEKSLFGEKMIDANKPVLIVHD